MGGRGASFASAASRGSALKGRLLGIAKQVDSMADTTAGQRDYAAIARAAAGLIGTSRLKGLLADRDVAALSRGLGGAGGFGNLGKLDSLAEGANRPLGMGDAAWASLKERLVRLNEAGYTNEEVSAAIRFDRWLREAT